MLPAFKIEKVEEGEKMLNGNEEAKKREKSQE